MLIASVVLDNSKRGFDKEYHYMVPSELGKAVSSGIRVIVPFGRADKPEEAYVIKVFEKEAAEGLKPVGKVVDTVPVLSPGMLELAGWMKNRYICTYSDAIRCMLPPGIGVKSLRKVKLIGKGEGLKGNSMKIFTLLSELDGECEYDELREKAKMRNLSGYLKDMIEKGVISIFEEYSAKVREKKVRVAFLSRPKDEIVFEIESDRIKRIQQIRVLEMLLDNEYISTADLARFAGVSAGVLDTLRKYGHIDFMDIEVNRDPVAGRDFARTTSMEPTREQALVLAALKSDIAGNRFKEVLLHGVTGSGKTEVYMQSIEACLKSARTAIVLVPEISLTPQMVERFKGRFGNEVAVLHSRLSMGERYDQWRLIRDGRIKVVVGARSAIFAPLQCLGIVIIDEEHESSYKSETTPKYHAREIAVKRCSYENALLIYGSATPSIETNFRAISGEISILRMEERANKMNMPKVDIIDMRKELDEGNRSVFSRRLAAGIESNINDGRQTILFLNRRGYSSFVMCRSCGYVVKCRYCNISLTYHSHDERLICHYCGYTVKSPETCPKCTSKYIKHFGTGTQKVEEELKKQFRGCSAVRMDMDTTGGKNSHEEILRTFRDDNINVMVGTQMIAKGHDFPNVTLVGVLAADSLLNSGDYRSSERTFQLITQVAGRAGRGEFPGRVVIQTYNTEDFSILAACRHDYGQFYRQEILVREKLQYPPFTNIAVIIFSGVNDKLVFAKSREVKEYIEKAFKGDNDDVSVLGPTRSPLSRIKNKYRWRIVIKGRNLQRLIDVLGAASDSFYSQKTRQHVDMGMDINPFNML